MKAFIFACLVLTAFSSNAAIINYTIGGSDYIYHSSNTSNPVPTSSQDTNEFDVWLRNTGITQMRGVAIYIPFDGLQSVLSDTFEIRLEQGFAPSFAGRMWRGSNHLWVTYESRFAENNLAHLQYPLSFAPDEWWLEFRFSDIRTPESSYFYINGPVQVFLSDEQFVAGNQFAIPASEPSIAALLSFLGLAGWRYRKHVS